MRHTIRLLICLVSLMLALPVLTPVVRAQGTPSTLAGRALLSAKTLADGPRSGQALQQGTINGVKVAFDSQPVGNVSAILPGAYPQNWVWLSSGMYDNRQNSGDYLLRLYKVEIDLHGANGGNGTVALSDWPTLADPKKKIQQAIKNANTPTRELTGADFDPLEFAQTADGSYWIAEGYGPSLLHVNGDGILLDAPIPLGGGSVQGMTLRPGGSLLIALRPSGGSTSVSLRAFDVSSKKSGGEVSVYTLDSAANKMSSFVAVNDHQALAVEQDDQQNQAAQYKRIFLVDFGAKPATKTLLVDLLNVADPQNISTASQFRTNSIRNAAVQPYCRAPFPWPDLES